MAVPNVLKALFGSRWFSESEWREYRITPGGGTPAERFLAPSLDDAFAQARARWPRSKQWTCIESVAA